MAGIPFWSTKTAVQIGGKDETYSTNPYDTVYFAGIQFPGICDVTNPEIAKIEIDNKKAKGSLIAKLTLLGYKPGRFDVTCEIWTSNHWDVTQVILDKLWNPGARGKRSKISDDAHDIRHPYLTALKVTQAALIGVIPPKKGQAEGTKVWTFQFHENVTAPDNKNVTKTVRSAVGIDPTFSLTQPENGVPARPSANKKNMSLSGPPKRPAKGAS